MTIGDDPTSQEVCFDEFYNQSYEGSTEFKPDKVKKIVRKEGEIEELAAESDYSQLGDDFEVLKSDVKVGKVKECEVSGASH